MSIDLKPAVRFLEKMVDKSVEIGKNMAAAAKHYPGLTLATAAVMGTTYLISGLCVAGFAHPQTPMAVKIGADAIFLGLDIGLTNLFGRKMNDVGNFIRMTPRRYRPNHDSNSPRLY